MHYHWKWPEWRILEKNYYNSWAWILINPISRKIETTGILHPHIHIYTHQWILTGIYPIITHKWEGVYLSSLYHTHKDTSMGISLSFFHYFWHFDLCAIPQQKPCIILPVQRSQTLRYIWLDCPIISSYVTKIHSNKVLQKTTQDNKSNVSWYHSVRESSLLLGTLLHCWYLLREDIHGEIRASQGQLVADMLLLPEKVSASLS